MVLVIKNLTANAGVVRDMDLSPGGEDSLKKGMAIHSNILTWRIPWTEEPGELWSIGSQRVTHNLDMNLAPTLCHIQVASF